MAEMTMTQNEIRASQARKTIYSKNFFVRIRSMLQLDFYRLFHTPAYYIMLAISAMIPAMVLGMTGQAEGGLVYTNTWQMIAALEPTYVVSDMGEYANINMIYIFSGILTSIFIGHDYMSGFVKNVFTVHSKKKDYVVSKIIVGVFCTLCMMVTYTIATVFAGLLTGKSFEVNVSGLLLCLLGKVILSVGFAALYVTINILMRRLMGLSITGCFFFGTGILIMGAAVLLKNNSALNIFLYGAMHFVSQCFFTTAVACANRKHRTSRLRMLTSIRGR